MTYAITLLTFDEMIDVEDDETILEIAVEENIPYPFGCRSGNCGACKSRLVLGDVHMRDHSSMALTEDEAARGLILACRAEPRSDCTLAVVNYDDALAHPLKQLVGTVTVVEKLTHDIAAVRISLPEPMEYTAGQFAAVAFPGFPARDYSFASPPDDPATLEFHIRRMGDDGVSAFVFDQLAAGEPVAVHGPMGYAFLREAETGPIFAIAGGSGLAPIRAIMQSALSKPDMAERPVCLWFGARTEADVYLEDELRALAANHPAFSYEIVLSEPEAGSPRRAGFVTDAFKADIEALGQDALDGARAYLAGPPPMVEAGSELLKALGLEQARIHADAFYTEAEKAALTGQ
jgi:CDP-4-dehydro-6-deoxyglucose reductase/ferredoxin-NAD(P)+ reductase (naphthalene dioxygenase ferredoxin-specific)